MATPRAQAALQTPVSGLPNVGPRSAAMLAAVGVTTLAQLRALGAVAAYAKVKQADARASLNLLWALEGALTGQAWQQVAREHRTRLLMALEDLQPPPNVRRHAGTRAAKVSAADAAGASGT